MKTIIFEIPLFFGPPCIYLSIYYLHLFMISNIYPPGPAPPRGVPGHGVAADQILRPAQPEVLRHAREVLRMGQRAVNQSFSPSTSTPIILHSL